MDHQYSFLMMYLSVLQLGSYMFSLRVVLRVICLYKVHCLLIRLPLHIVSCPDHTPQGKGLVVFVTFLVSHSSLRNQTTNQIRRSVHMHRYSKISF